FVNSQIFADTGNAFSHLAHIIDNRRIAVTEKTSDDAEDNGIKQLDQLCRQYIERFSKRMKVVSKRGGNTLTERRLNWAQTLRLWLESPFSGLGPRIIYITIALLVVASCFAVIMQSIPAFNPDLFPQYAPKWDALELTVSLLLLTEFLLRLIAYT